jgi:ubiquinone/menaquinone biosynthesis C-methylase UbiE
MWRIPDTAELAPVRTLDYDAIGDARANYHEVRPLSRFDLEVFGRVHDAIGLRQGLRVLDVGCGTGRFSLLLADAGAKVTGVDKSANMLAVARDDARAATAGVDYVCADANDKLPHGPFDALTFFFSMHYMQLKPAFWRRLVSSLGRGGTIAVASFPLAHFAQTEHARFFPSIACIDMARFPSIPRLCSLLQDNGFGNVTVNDIEWHEETPAHTLISRTAARYLSTFHLLPAAEFERGLAAMRAAYATVTTVARTIRAAVISAQRRDGER